MSTSSSKLSGLILILVVVLPFIIVEKIGVSDPYSFVYSRFQQILEATKTDVLNWNKMQVVLIGPSDIAINVSSRELETNLEKNVGRVEIRNYSVIQGGPNVLVRVLEGLLSQVNQVQKIDLLIFRFQPMMYTKEYTAFNSRNLLKFGQYSDLGSTVIDDPSTIFTQLTSKVYGLALQGGKAEGSLFSYFGEVYRNLNSQKNTDEIVLDEARKTYSKIWTDYGIYADNNRFVSMDQMDFFDSLRSVDNKYDEGFFDENQKKLYFGGYESHLKHFNFIHYNFDPKRIEDLKRILKLCKQLSKKTLILVADDILENDYRKPQTSAQTRLSRLLESELSEQEIIYYRPQAEQNFSSKDYFDLVHYRPAGIKKFSHFLAQIIFKELEIKK